MQNGQQNIVGGLTNHLLFPPPLPDRTLEDWVGRTKADSVEQPHKTASSHVARMVGGTRKPDKKPFEMVRHSQPYGTVTGESGLFFIG